MPITTSRLTRHVFPLGLVVASGCGKTYNIYNDITYQTYDSDVTVVENGDSCSGTNDTDSASRDTGVAGTTIPCHDGYLTDPLDLSTLDAVELALRFPYDKRKDCGAPWDDLMAGCPTSTQEDPYTTRTEAAGCTVGSRTYSGMCTSSTIGYANTGESTWSAWTISEDLGDATSDWQQSGSYDYLDGSYVNGSSGEPTYMSEQHFTYYEREDLVRGSEVDSMTTWFLDMTIETQNEIPDDGAHLAAVHGYAWVSDVGTALTGDFCLQAIRANDTMGACGYPTGDGDADVYLYGAQTVHIQWTGDPSTCVWCGDVTVDGQSLGQVCDFWPEVETGFWP